MSGTNQEIEGPDVPAGPAGGELSGFYPNPTLVNSAVIGKVLTGYVSGAGTVLATDTILEAIQKLNGNIVALPTITASNGLTKTGNDIALGGDLTGNTSIDGAFSLNFGLTTPLTSYAIKAGSLAAFTGEMRVASNETSFKIVDNTSGRNDSVGVLSTGSYIWAYNTASVTDSVSINVNNTAVANVNNGANNFLIIRDTSASKGAIYFADYSANFTFESLVTKRYVDNAITTATITASNGLTKTGNNIKLGGALINTTNITGAFQLTVNLTADILLKSNGLIESYSTDAVNGAYLQTYPGFTYMAVQDEVSLNVAHIQGDIAGTGVINNGANNVFTIRDEVFNKGIIYSDDYSANFTPESLITKRYADALIGDYVIKAVAYVLLPADGTSEVTVAGATQTLPTAVGKLNKRYRIINASNGVVRVDTTLSQTIGNSSVSNPTFIDLMPEEWLDVISNNTNWRMI